jgi:hypothetical protein
MMSAGVRAARLRSETASVEFWDARGNYHDR